MTKDAGQVMALRVLFLISFLILSSCQKQGGDSSSLMGIKEFPDININLLAINPSNQFLNINQTKQFYATGGKDPYTFSMSSGGGSISATGLYTAPAYSTNAVIEVKDGNGKEAYATISVNTSLSMTPTSITIGTNTTTTLSASGGLPPYTYSIASGTGSINATTGLYNSAAVPPGTTIIKVTDSANNAAYSAVIINPTLIISPSVASIGKSETVQLSVSGGRLPYTYSKLSGNGSVNSVTGLYSAPASTGTTFIRVTDGDGNTSDAVINIVNKPQLTPEQTRVATSHQIQFSVTDGTAPFTYAVVAGGGSINSSTGLFTAPASADVVTVRVTDNNGYYDDISITVFTPMVIAPGYYHTCALTFPSAGTNKVKCWGAVNPDMNRYGALGTSAPKMMIGDEASDMGDNLSYIDFGTGLTVSDFFYGKYSGCALLSNNQVKCFGPGGNGQFISGSAPTYVGNYTSEMGDNLVALNFGTGRTLKLTRPFKDVISEGNSTFCAILDNDQLKCWGYGGYGKRASGDTSDYGALWNHSMSSLSAIDIGGSEVPKKVVVSTYNTCVLTVSGKVKCWGQNNQGLLGQGDTLQRGHTSATLPNTYSYIDLGTGLTAKDITVADSHACALLNDNTVKCWGYNGNGELGVNDNISRGDNPGEMGDNLPRALLGTGKTVVKIISNINSNCALLNDATLKCWGYNNYGQLGLGVTTGVGTAVNDMGDALPTVDVGTGRTVLDFWKLDYGFCAKLDDSSTKCWGYNLWANLGLGHLFNVGRTPLSMGDYLSPINVGTGKTITTMGGGPYASCALLNDQKVKCWGVFYKGDGLHAIGDVPNEMGANLPEVNLGSYVLKDLKSLGSFSCGLTTSNQLLCWGQNSSGQLGIENTFNQGRSFASSGDVMLLANLGTGRSVKEYSVGEAHVCAILDDNSLKCWGDWSNGKLGIGNTNRGSTVNTMGDNLPAVNLGTGLTPKKITATHSHSCVVLTDGRVKCWGFNNFGQLGYGDIVDRGANPSTDMGDNLPFVDLGTGKLAKDICGGAYNTCVQLTDNTVKCWGHLNYAGNGYSVHMGDNPGEMGDNLNVIDLGTNFTVDKLVCGQTHHCALSTDGKVKCWGTDSNGRVGNGAASIGTVGTNPSQLGDALAFVNLGTGRKAIDIRAGLAHTCAVLDNGKFKCWGYNFYGQLGLGHRSDMGSTTVTVGDYLPYVEIE